MIQKLSDFLRGILRREENQWITFAEELQQLEGVLKKVGKRAESLAEKPRAILES